MTKPFGIYLHIPFCRKKCAYCDFYSAATTPETVSRYVARLKDEIEKWGGSMNRPVDSLYIGGGTPSLLPVGDIAALVGTVQDKFTVLPHAEITVEVNPENASPALFDRLLACGVNRLSLGIQSGSNAALSLIGRGHTAQEGAAAYSMAKSAGFSNISVDVMFGLPKTGYDDFAETLGLLKRLNPVHLSGYMLILEDRTVLARNQQNYTFPTEDEIAAQYLDFCRFASENGYMHYEISNFAKPGFTGQHNLKYWHDEEYLGIGPSAYSFLDGRRFHCPRSLHGFLNDAQTEFDEPGGTFCEYIMLALRLSEGLTESGISRFQKTFSQLFVRKAETLCEAGLAEFDGRHFSLTDRGMLVSNSIICEMTEENLYENL